MQLIIDFHSSQPTSTAPALEDYEKTLTLSVLLAGLTIFPICIFIGSSGTIGFLFTEHFELVNAVSQGYLKLLTRNAFLVIFGAFVGSVVFPLGEELFYYCSISFHCSNFFQIGIAHGKFIQFQM